MSHISKIELQVNDLSVLGAACVRLELDLVRSKKSFKWYGKDAPCDHAIRVPQAEYEIGVIDRDGSFELNCDFYDGNLGQVIGKNGGLLKQAYAIEKTKIEARRKGYSVLEHKIDNGIRLQVRIA